MSEPVSFGIGTAIGVGLGVKTGFDLFGPTKPRKSAAAKAVTQFRKATRRYPDLPPEQAIREGRTAGEIQKFEKQLLSQARVVAYEAGYPGTQQGMADFYLTFFPNAVLQAAQRGGITRANREILRVVPNAERTAQVRLGIAEDPTKPPRPTDPTRRTWTNAGLEALRLLLESLFGRGAAPATGPTRVIYRRRQPMPLLGGSFFQAPANYDDPLGAFGGGGGSPWAYALGAGAQALGQIFGKQPQYFDQPQLPAIPGSGGMIGRTVDWLQGQTGSTCITPVPTPGRLTWPKRVDIPTTDAAGNPRVKTYVRAPECQYNVTVRGKRRRRGCR